MQLLLLFLMLGSLAGIVFVLWRKLPELKRLSPQDAKEGVAVPLRRMQKVVSSQKTAQRAWAGARSLAAKTESQRGELFGKLQRSSSPGRAKDRKNEETKDDFAQSYWQDLRKKTTRVPRVPRVRRKKATTIKAEKKSDTPLSSTEDTPA